MNTIKPFLGALTAAFPHPQSNHLPPNEQVKKVKGLAVEYFNKTTEDFSPLLDTLKNVKDLKQLQAGNLSDADFEAAEKALSSVYQSIQKIEKETTQVIQDRRFIEQARAQLSEARSQFNARQHELRQEGAKTSSWSFLNVFKRFQPHAKVRQPITASSQNEQVRQPDVDKLKFYFVEHAEEDDEKSLADVRETVVDPTLRKKESILLAPAAVESFGLSNQELELKVCNQLIQDFHRTNAWILNKKVLFSLPELKKLKETSDQPIQLISTPDYLAQIFHALAEQTSSQEEALQAFEPLTMLINQKLAIDFIKKMKSKMAVNFKEHFYDVKSSRSHTIEIDTQKDKDNIYLAITLPFYFYESEEPTHKVGYMAFKQEIVLPRKELQESLQFEEASKVLGNLKVVDHFSGFCSTEEAALQKVALNRDGIPFNAV